MSPGGVHVGMRKGEAFCLSYGQNTDDCTSGMLRPYRIPIYQQLGTQLAYSLMYWSIEGQKAFSININLLFPSVRGARESAPLSLKGG